MPHSVQHDYYEILGVSSDASQDEIRKAFQKKARTLHPDVNKAPEAEEEFKALSEAYAVLSDPSKRASYDRQRSYGFSSPSSNTPYDSQSWQYGGVGFSPFDIMFDVMNNSQQTSAHGESRAYKPRPGKPISIHLKAEHYKDIAGKTQTLRYKHFETCETCHGTGSQSDHPSSMCPLCQGTGMHLIDTGLFGVMQVTCSYCEGTGSVVADVCPDCKGTGRHEASTSCEVTLTSRYERVQTYAGKGNAGYQGGDTSDLLVYFHIADEKLSEETLQGLRYTGFALGLIPHVLRGASPFWFVVSTALVLYGLFHLIKGGFSLTTVWFIEAFKRLFYAACVGFVLATLFAILF